MMSGSDRVEPLRVLLSRLQPDDQLLSRPSPDATLQLDLQAGLSPRATICDRRRRTSQPVRAGEQLSVARCFGPGPEYGPCRSRLGLASLGWTKKAKSLEVEPSHGNQSRQMNGNSIRSDECASSPS